MNINNNIYKLIKKEYIKDIECTGYVLEHIKTKATICLLENDDENKAFTIGFKTPPMDDTGVCHIIEHTVLSGSSKYPVKEPFLELMKSSLNTFLNAMTYPDRTIYPVSSCNDKDFINLMDVYLDAVFNPLIYSKEQLFKQEGWHYELQNEEDDITINGIVYNEMKGAFSSADDLLNRLTYNALYKDTCYKYESGGDPVAIPNLTYQDFLNYHKNHYNPTNSVIVLYGNMNFEDVLEYIDKDYLSKYDYLPNNFIIESQFPFDKIKKITDTYQLPRGLDKNNKTYLSYAISFDEATPDIDLAALDIINTALFVQNGAPLERAILDAKIGGVVTSNATFELKQSSINIVVEEANEENGDKLINVIDTNLEKIVKEHIDRKTLESLISKAEFKFKEKNYGRVSKGIYHALTIIPNVIYNLDPFKRLNKEYIYEELRNKLNTNYFEELIEKYLLNNNHKVLVTLNPSESKKEKEDQELKQKLDNYKKSLSKEELKQLVQDTKDILEYLQKEDTKEDLETIPTLKLSDIDLFVDDIKNEEVKLDNLLVLKHNYETSDIIYLDLFFKTDKLNEQNYKSLGLLGDLLFLLSTKTKEYTELTKDINILIGRMDKSIISFRKTNETFMDFRFAILKNNLDNALQLIKEVYSQTKFDEVNHIKELIQNLLSDIEESFAYSGNRVATNCALSSFDKCSYIKDLTAGVRYYDFLKELLKDSDLLVNELNNNLPKLLDSLITKENLFITIGCNDELYKYSEPYLLDLINNLNHGSINNSLSFNPTHTSLAFNTPYDVNYNALVFNLEKELSGVRCVTNKIINTDYLWKKVRVLGGAYGAGISINESGIITMSSYRDPKIDQTLDVYKNIPNYLNDLNIETEDLNKYIIGTIGDCYYPKSVSSLSNISTICYKLGKTKEDLIKEKKEILNTKLKDIKEYIELFNDNLNNSSICVIGNEKDIQNSKTKFDDVKQLLK